jgi:putative ABC transport system substrate-binding protein
MRLIGLAVVLALSLVLALAADAQQAAKVARIGYLGVQTPTVAAKAMDELRAGLRDLGWVEGKNIVIEYRWAEGKYDRLSDLAAELVRLGVDVIVTGGTPAIRAAKQATTTIPIVMTASGDAVASGLVASLARPAGNVTGSTFFVPEFMAKRLELLKEARPHIKRVAVLVNPDDPSHVPVLKTMETTARSLKIELQAFKVRRPSEFESAFSAMAKSRVDAVVVQEDGLLAANAGLIADSATKKQFPSAGNTVFAEAGGQIGYGVNQLALMRRAAWFSPPRTAE